MKITEQEKDIITFFKKRKLYPQFRVLANCISILESFQYDVRDIELPQLTKPSNKLSSMDDAQKILTFIVMAQDYHKLGEDEYNKKYNSNIYKDINMKTFFKYVTEPQYIKTYALYMGYNSYNKGHN